MPRVGSSSSALTNRETIGRKSKILEAELFAILLRRERERANRTQQTLSLAVFYLKGKTEPEIDAFCKSLFESIRSIDEIGWIAETDIGVLLPSTTYDGARVFVDRVLPGHSEYAIYSYPESWTPDYKESHESEEEQMHLKRRHIASIFSISIPIWKRAMDICGSLFGFFLLAPLFLIVIVYIEIVSPGPAFFKQRRVGQGGKLFTFIKFRTMRPDNNQGVHQDFIVKKIRAGESLAKFDSIDPRIIPGGRILRKMCIDELPQLWNVLVGEMSLVGPRPCLPCEAKEFIVWHTHRFDAIPGMTGLWQVSGKNKLTLPQMIRLDILYMENLSFRNDMRILLATIPAISVMVAESIAKKIDKKTDVIERDLPNGAAV